MKEKPISFNSEMVRAILDGRKTQTRRVIKPQPGVGSYKGWVSSQGVWRNTQSFPGDRWKCRYGQVGDRLWVRETFWQGNSPTYGKHCVVYHADKKIAWHEGTPFDNPDLEKDFRKMPSIFMPRWASRITLEITDIRVERVQDISLEDMWCEGVLGTSDELLASMWYDLWNSINEKRGYGWEVNPWVWVVEFKGLT
jgi:hypothetical protein